MAIKAQMNRRDMLAGSAAALGGLALPYKALAAGASLEDAAREAWLYSVPLVEVSNVRRRVLANGSANVFRHNRNLTNVQTQRVTSPNNDTMYSHGVLDLRAGNVEVTLPPTGERYLSVQLVDMYSNTVAVLGTRATGSDGGRFIVAGPTADAPIEAIRTPQHWAFILARSLVDGPADVAAVRAIQDGLAIKGIAGPAPQIEVPSRDAAWRTWFDGVGKLLIDCPPPSTDGALLDRIGHLGLSRAGFRPPKFGTDAVAQIEAGIAAARSIVAQTQLGKKVVDGWAYPPYDLGDFEQDYPFRAQIAVSGLFALPLAEALYTRSTGDAPDGLFHGDNYHLHFNGKNLPPVDAFWSITLYEARPDGQFFFTQNPVDRYAIGDRTPGLVWGADGSLDLLISRADPGQARRSNWLPAPKDKPFMLSMRAYLPQPALLNGAYHFPPIRRSALLARHSAILG
jgi:hypothetical protein